MHIRTFRRLLPLVVLALVILPVATGYSQGSAGRDLAASDEAIVSAVPNPAPTAAAPASAPAADHVVYLPLILKLPSTVSPLQLASSSNDQCKQTSPPGTTFAFGITYLCVRTTLQDAQGMTFLFEWTVDGKRAPELDFSGTVSGSTFSLYDYICQFGSTNTCGPPLPRGTYSVNFFLDNVLYRSATATIQ